MSLAQPFSFNRVSSSRSELSVPFLDIPELKGPINRDLGDIFIRESSVGVTPIWYHYKRSDESWHWTPYEDFQCWMSVFDLKVSSGYWKGHKPAMCNIRIINYLASKNPIPPYLDSSKLLLSKTEASSCIVKNPYVIIVGIANYDKPLKSLSAVKTDVTKMKKLWKDIYNFQHVVCANDHIEVKNEQKITSKTLRTYFEDQSKRICDMQHKDITDNDDNKKNEVIDGLILVISGHGTEKNLICSDCSSLPISDIEQIFNLKGFVKIAIVDCYRGTAKYLSDEKEEKEKMEKGDSVSINKSNDFVIHFSIVDDYLLYCKNDEFGSYFLGHVYERFLNNKEKDKKLSLNQLFKTINENVCNDSKGKQSPEIIDRTSYNIFIQ